MIWGVGRESSWHNIALGLFKIGVKEKSDFILIKTVRRTVST